MYAKKNFIRARLQTLLKLFRPVVTRAPSVKMTNDCSSQDFGYQQVKEVLSLVNPNLGEFHKFSKIDVQATPFLSPDYKIFMKT